MYCYLIHDTPKGHDGFTSIKRLHGISDRTPPLKIITVKKKIIRVLSYNVPTAILTNRGRYTGVFPLECPLKCWDAFIESVEQLNKSR